LGGKTAGLATLSLFIHFENLYSASPDYSEALTTRAWGCRCYYGIHRKTTSTWKNVGTSRFYGLTPNVTKFYLLIADTKSSLTSGNDFLQIFKVLIHVHALENGYTGEKPDKCRRLYGFQGLKWCGNGGNGVPTAPKINC